MKRKQPLVSENESLLLDWDWEKNSVLGFDPHKLTCGSNKTAHWKCHICGYEYTTRIERKAKGSMCKKCLGKTYSVAPREKSLLALYPEIAAEWDYEKNDTTPDKVYPNSNIKYWWRCKEHNHSWDDNASHRTMRKNGCPYCSGHRLLPGFNDLATKCPNLLSEWDYEKNTVLPTEISCGTHEEVYWKCARGHGWKTAAYVRALMGHGCPQCNKELKTSFPEKIIAYYMSSLFSNVIENYRSKELGSYEIDIYIPRFKLGIEYDGAKWHKNSERDKNKDKLCEKLNITLIRVREKGCVEYDSSSIKYHISQKSTTKLTDAINSIVSFINKKYGFSLSLDIDLDRDGATILSKVYSIIKERSVANSNLIKEWDTERNKGVDPQYVPIFSNKYYWWICEKGHFWHAQVSKRSIGRNCPYCANQRVWKGFNDLASQYPNLLKEWDYEKNDKRPDEVIAWSDKPAYWICSKCGRHWKTNISTRTVMGCGCKICGSENAALKSRKSVIDLDTGIIYESMKEAGESFGITYGAISACVHGKTKTAGGHHWKLMK